MVTEHSALPLTLLQQLKNEYHHAQSSHSHHRRCRFHWQWAGSGSCGRNANYHIWVLENMHPRVNGPNAPATDLGPQVKFLRGDVADVPVRRPCRKALCSI